MIENRSLPMDTLLAHVWYQDLGGAIKWLIEAFGFSEHYRYGDPLSGAQLHLANAWIMVNQARAGYKSPAMLGFGTQTLTVFVEGVEGHYQRAKAAGAKILEEPHETVYGEFQYAAEDLDGHHWLFSRHARDLRPEEWGATVKENPRHRLALLRRPRWCYVEIPAADAQRSADFYEKVFGWNIRHRDSKRPSFDDATGNISGAWVEGRECGGHPGLMAYIWVDSIHASLAQIAANGGEAVLAPQPDSPGSTSWIATFRDPAGNLIGLYQEDLR